MERNHPQRCWNHLRQSRGDRFQVVAKGPSFTATLTWSRAATESVTIQSQDEQTRVKGASIALQRGS